MRKKRIRISEAQLRRTVNEAVKRLMCEQNYYGTSYKWVDYDITDGVISLNADAITDELREYFDSNEEYDDFGEYVSDHEDMIDDIFYRDAYCYIDKLDEYLHGLSDYEVCVLAFQACGTIADDDLDGWLEGDGYSKTERQNLYRKEAQHVLKNRKLAIWLYERFTNPYNREREVIDMTDSNIRKCMS